MTTTTGLLCCKIAWMAAFCTLRNCASSPSSRFNSLSASTTRSSLHRRYSSSMASLRAAAAPSKRKPLGLYAEHGLGQRASSSPSASAPMNASTAAGFRIYRRYIPFVPCLQLMIFADLAWYVAVDDFALARLPNVLVIFGNKNHRTIFDKNSATVAIGTIFPAPINDRTRSLRRSNGTLAVHLQQHQVFQHLMPRAGNGPVDHRPQLRHGELDVAVQQCVPYPVNHALSIRRVADLEAKRTQPQNGIHRRRLAAILLQRHEAARHVLDKLMVTRRQLNGLLLLVALFHQFLNRRLPHLRGLPPACSTNAQHGHGADQHTRSSSTWSCPPSSCSRSKHLFCWTVMRYGGRLPSSSPSSLLAPTTGNACVRHTYAIIWTHTSLYFSMVLPVWLALNGFSLLVLPSSRRLMYIIAGMPTTFEVDAR
ncbi:hypothetical protein HBH99_129760 [Parastagonospora nodorum]|nr:hypothetical protein HBH99_129760 [Parastagonospora nodorum]